MTIKTLRCWCGNKKLISFTKGYLRCSACETLISDKSVKVPSQRVRSEEKDFYGKNYWFAHQEKDFNYPNILERAKADLAGRCSHWLNSVLQFKLPPGKILEVGSAHGGLVALLHWAGFESFGLELSPWVVKNAQESFGVPVFQGPVEDQDIQSNSLDVIIMMDVLEHLPNPQGTLRHCLNLLKSEGFIFIQTPRYPEGSSFEELVGRKDPFLEQLKDNEHLFLFSEKSIHDFFSRLGCEFVRFVPAVFPHYDMSLMASRKRLKKHSHKTIQKTLIKSPIGRLIQAFLLLKSDYQELKSELDLSDTDRKERMIQIEKLTMQLNESEQDRKSRMEQIRRLTRLLKESEQDRKARMAQITELTGLLKKSEKDREARLVVIGKWEARYKEMEADRKSLREQIRRLTQLLRESEQDRKARMTQITELTGLLKESEKDREARMAQVDEWETRYREMEADRKSRMGQIIELTQLLRNSELDRDARMVQIDELSGLLKKSEKDRGARMAQIDELTRLLRACETNRAESVGMLEEMNTKITSLKEKIVVEENKTLELEKDLNALERTRIVRAAKGIGLIKAKRMDSKDDPEKEI